MPILITILGRCNKKKAHYKFKSIDTISPRLEHLSSTISLNHQPCLRLVISARSTWKELGFFIPALSKLNRFMRFQFGIRYNCVFWMVPNTTEVCLCFKYSSVSADVWNEVLVLLFVFSGWLRTYMTFLMYFLLMNSIIPFFLNRFYELDF